MTDKPRHSGASRHSGEGPRSGEPGIQQVSKQVDSGLAPAARPGMTSLDDFILAGAQALKLEFAPDWLPAVRMNLQVTLRHAALVGEFALPDDSEPAPVFEA